MKKTKVKAKKTDAKKVQVSKKKTLLDGAAKSIRKLGKKSGLGKLSTTQKVVGGTALLALGLGYLAQRPKNVADVPPADVAAAEDRLAGLDGSSL